MSAAAVQKTPPGRRPGRPRSAEADQAIVAATVAVLMDDGYRALRMEAVVARSGVGKATLYRRFGSKAELVAHVVRHLNRGIAAPDTGSLEGDWIALADTVRSAARTTNSAVFLPRLLAESAGDPELHRIFYENLVQPRRAATREVLERAIVRGELREDLDLELAMDVLAGPIIYRLLIAGGDIEQLPDPAEFLAFVMRGLAR
jgi:AcrR family transcriptional regulator